jgi:hypothetical protein
MSRKYDESMPLEDVDDQHTKFGQAMERNSAEIPTDYPQTSGIILILVAYLRSKENPLASIALCCFINSPFDSDREKLQTTEQPG